MNQTLSINSCFEDEEDAYHPKSIRMRAEYVIFVFMISTVFAIPAPFPDKPSEKPHERDSYKKYGDDDTSYKFWYQVDEKDHYDRKLDFGHHEEKDDNGKVTGHYFVLLPDTQKLRVDYKVDDYSGFVADVTYEGTAVFPDKKSYKRKGSYEKDSKEKKDSKKKDNKEKKDSKKKDSKEKKDSYKY